jgi:hypothetical protein
LEKFIEKAAVMDLLLEDHVGDDINRTIERYKVQHQDACDTKAKSLYVELMGEVLSQSE